MTVRSCINLYAGSSRRLLGAPRQLPSPAGREHGRTIPLADIRCFTLNINSSVQLPFTRHALEHMATIRFESERRSCN